MRTCLVCRGKRPKAELLRLALEEQLVCEDLGQVMPGRGAYVCRRSNCLSQLRFDRRLQRAFRGKARAMSQVVGAQSLLEEPSENGNIDGRSSSYPDDRNRG
jgi:uncharacterized protein